jgi:hypothetical protein
MATKQKNALETMLEDKALIERLANEQNSTPELIAEFLKEDLIYRRAVFARLGEERYAQAT